MDVHTKEQRSYNMSQIRDKNTKIEILFRSYIWKKGIRGYRLHKKLPGRPDLYFTKKKIAVFLDGCYWHKCPSCFIAPKSNKSFWKEKIDSNVERDKKNNKILKTMGITILRFWEHEIKGDIDKCYRKLKSKL